MIVSYSDIFLSTLQIRGACSGDSDPSLGASGVAVASIPNVRRWPVTAHLMLHDEWKYGQDGILDVTQLRFFTLKSAVRLFAETKYLVQLVQPYFSGRRYSIPNRFTFGLLSGFLAQRWLIRLQTR